MLTASQLSCHAQGCLGEGMRVGGRVLGKVEGRVLGEVGGYVFGEVGGYVFGEVGGRAKLRFKFALW